MIAGEDERVIGDRDRQPALVPSLCLGTRCLARTACASLRRCVRKPYATERQKIMIRERSVSLRLLMSEPGITWE